MANDANAELDPSDDELVAFAKQLLDERSGPDLLSDLSTLRETILGAREHWRMLYAVAKQYDPDASGKRRAATPGSRGPSRVPRSAGDF